MISRFIDFFKGLMWTPSRKLLSDETAGPEAFRPHRTNRWILTVEGFDTFLARDVELPAFSREPDDSLVFGTLTVVFYEIEGASNFKVAMDLMKNYTDTSGKRTATFKYLDDTGRVTEVWTMVVCPSHVQSSSLTYDSHNVTTTCVEFEVKDLNVVISGPSQPVKQ